MLAIHTADAVQPDGDLVRRIDALCAQVAEVRGELDASKGQREALLDALKSLSEQLRLAAAVEDLAEMEYVLELASESRRQEAGSLTAS